MGFADCSEDSIRDRQKESYELKANFEETIKKLNQEKNDLEQLIQQIKQD